MWWHTRRETRFCLCGQKDESISIGRLTSLQSTAGSRSVRISGSNAGYTMIWGILNGTGYPLHSTVSTFTFPHVRHRVPSHFNWSLLNRPGLRMSRISQVEFLTTVGDVRVLDFPSLPAAYSRPWRIAFRNSSTPNSCHIHCIYPAFVTPCDVIIWWGS